MKALSTSCVSDDILSLTHRTWVEPSAGRRGEKTDLVCERLGVDRNQINGSPIFWAGGRAGRRGRDHGAESNKEQG